MAEPMSDPAAKAKDYREGFVEGVRTVLKAIGDDLPEQQMRVLQKWADQSLEAWRHADAGASRPVVPMIDGA